MDRIKFELDSEIFDMQTVKKIFDLYFNGNKNIVTPQLRGYDAIITKSRIALFEINSNREETLFGVTSLCYDRTTRKISRINLNKLVDTESDVVDYLNNITLAKINLGDLYGETI